MPLSHEELLAACAAGDIVAVRHAILSLRQSGTIEVPLKTMALKAAENDQAAILEYCIDEGAEVSDLNLHDVTNSDEVLKVLISKGCLDVNEDLETGGDLLINAVWELKYDFTNWLLEHGADPNSGHLMADSTSAITAAAERGRVDFAESLVKHGAKVSGSGALAGAAGNKQSAMVQWLLDRGADINEVGVHDFGDRRNQVYEGSALHKAAANGDIEMAKLLVERGANLEVKDPVGRTPLMRAMEEKQEDAAAYLRSVQRTG